MEIQGQLRNGGKISRGRIGVVIQEVTKELAESFGLAKPQGALVVSVEKGGPAEKAGIETGDIITRFNGKVIEQSSDLPRVVGNTKPGGKAMITVWHKGGERELSVGIAEMPEEKMAANPHGRRGGKNAEPAAANRLGLVLTEPSAEQKRELKLTAGLLVEDVRSGASHFDVRPGDILLAMIIKGSQTELKSVEQFNKLLAGLDKSAVFTLLVRRGENQTFVTVKGLGDKPSDK
jgi:serine protease Do